MLKYHRIPDDNVYCTPHGVWNKVKDMIALMAGKFYTTKHHKMEKALNPARAASFVRKRKLNPGEVDEFGTAKKTVYMWSVSEPRQNWLDQFVEERMLRWARPGGELLRAPFGGVEHKYFSIHHAILLCSRCVSGCGGARQCDSRMCTICCTNIQHVVILCNM